MQYSIVNYSEVVSLPDFRIDAEYWHPSFIKNSKTISHKNKIRDFVENNILNIRSYPVYGNFNYLEISNIYLSNYQYKTNIIHEGEYPDRATYMLQKKDIAVSTVRPNRNAVAFIEKDGIIGSSGLAILRANNIESEYLAVFCKTTYFTTCLMRANKATMYPAVSNSDIQNTPIFVPSEELKKSVIQLFNRAFAQNQVAQKKYKQSQTILLTELGLSNWQPKHQLCFVKNYSDTQQAGRIDADYFQPKYEEIEKAIRSHPRGYSTIGAEFKNIKDTFGIDNNKVYKYVEIGSVNVANGEIVPNEVVGEELPANAKRVLKKNDVIVSKVRTYRGAITIVVENGYVGSGAFTVLRENGQINKETLLTFLHSKPLLALSLKPNTGTSYPVIIENDILNLPIPLLPQEIQTQIQQKITESCALRKQSKHLLECAKQAVEMAIEKDEKSALEWLEAQQMGKATAH